MMMVSDILELSFQNLRLHKTRSVLTSLGVIFGVGSVIAMLAISEGAKRSALSQIEAMGIDKIIVYSRKAVGNTVQTTSSRRGQVERYGLTERDRVHLAALENIERITPIRNTRAKLLKGQQELDLKLVGAGLHFLEDSSSRLVSTFTWNFSSVIYASQSFWRPFWKTRSP